MRGKIITLSGLDGAGKSGQVARLERRLGTLDFKVRSIWLRVGYTSGFQAVKRWVRLAIPRASPTKNGVKSEDVLKNPFVKELWLLISLAELFFVTSVMARIWSLLGFVVIYDRYLCDSEIDVRMRFPKRSTLFEKSWSFVKRCARTPDHPLLLELPCGMAQERLKAKEDPYPISSAVLARRARYYSWIARSGSVEVIDATRSPREVTDAIIEAVYVGD